MPNRKKKTPVRKRRTRNRRARPKYGLGMREYAEMVENPCTSQLHPGIYGSSEGLLSRVKRSVYNTADANAGYILWCPRYHNRGAEERFQNFDTTSYFNVLTFATAHSSTVPTNNPTPALTELQAKVEVVRISGGVATVLTPEEEAKLPSVEASRFAGPTFATPLGFTESLSSLTVGSIADPAAADVRPSGFMADARTISACIRMTYTGRMDESAGMVAFIENLPTEVILGPGGSEPLSTNASVDDLFQLSTSTQRLGIDTLEVVYRGHESHAPVFTDFDDCPMLNDTWNTSTSKYTGKTNVNDAPEVSPSWFGFAWRGLGVPASSASLTFDLYKILEWRPDHSIGFPIVPPKTLNTTNVISKVHQALDNRNPSWSRKVIDSSASLAATVVRMAGTGLNYIERDIGRTLSGFRRPGSSQNQLMRLL